MSKKEDALHKLSDVNSALYRLTSEKMLLADIIPSIMVVVDSIDEITDIVEDMTEAPEKLNERQEK